MYVAYSGDEAIDQFRRQHPSVVLLDIGLPDRDGYDIARQLNQEDHKSFLVALTGYSGDQDRIASEQAGFQAHLVKPVDLEALRALLSRA